MKCPFVTRGRFEDLQKQCASLEAERKMLLERLLGSPERREEVKEPVRAVVVAAETKASDGAPQSFSTPFDRIERRFDAALHGGELMSQKFRARVN